MILKRVEKDQEVNMLIKSSTILATKYDKGTKELTVTFNKGGQYRYNGVKETDYIRFELAESQGKAFNKYIKPYTFDKLDEADTTKIHASIDGVKAEVEGYILNIMKQFIEDCESNGGRFPTYAEDALDGLNIEVEKYKSI
jgi:hypothetical protein